MDWTALGATAFGAALALSGTVASDLLRGRREREQDDTQQRRTAYVDYLVAISAVHGRLRALARSGLTGHDLKAASRDAFPAESLYENRERLLLVASPSVVGAAQAALLSLRDVRSAIGAGATLGSPAYHDTLHPLSENIWRLRAAFRADLGAEQYRMEDLNVTDWSHRSECEHCAGRAA